MSDKDNLDLFEDSDENREYLNQLLPEVFMSTGDVQKFNPTAMLDSLIRETGLSLNNAKRVTELVIRRIIASGIKFLSGPHIRELVCSALSELHFEEERKRFTRIGMPIRDYEALLQSKYNERVTEYTAPQNIHRWAADQLASEYALLKLLNTDQNRSHLSGDLHIHSLRFFDMRALGQSWDLRMIFRKGFPPAPFMNAILANPAKNAMTAILHAIKWQIFTHSEFAGSQNFLYFNIFIAPYLRGLNYKAIKQLAQTFVFETNQQYIAQGSHLPASAIVCAPNIPKILRDVPAIGPGGQIIGTYGDYEEESKMFFNALAEIFIDGDSHSRLFPFPKHHILIDSHTIEPNDLVFKEASVMGSPTFINSNLFVINKFGYLGEFFSNNDLEFYITDNGLTNLFDWHHSYMNFGVLQAITLNLPRLAYNSKGNEDRLFELLENLMDVAKDIILIKYNIIHKLLENKKLPIASSIITDFMGERDEDQQLLDLRKESMAISFVGLNEMVKAHTGNELHESEDAINFGKKVLEYMRSKCKQYTQEENIFFTLWQQNSEFPTYRFAALDLSHYKTNAEKIVKGNAKNGNVYYTNSAQASYTIKDLAIRRNVHSTFSSLIQNNFELPIWLENSSNSDITSKLKSLTLDLLNANINQFSFNYDFTSCLNCLAFNRGIYNECPKCGAKGDKIGIISKITDYYTPLEIWNSGKKEEFKDRYRLNL
ncbi:MAG: anaerobic ribonucleoside-triphosphate reductase [Promethearchaeota archaeon]